jgi:hypothetical protein
MREQGQTPQPALKKMGRSSLHNPTQRNGGAGSVSKSPLKNGGRRINLPNPTKKIRKTPIYLGSICPLTHRTFNFFQTENEEKNPKQ